MNLNVMLFLKICKIIAHAPIIIIFKEYPRTSINYLKTSFLGKLKPFNVKCIS